MSTVTHKNIEIRHEGERYEIFWKTLFADHVLGNYPDPLHHITFSEISQLLQRTLFTDHLRRGRQTNYYAFLGVFGNAAYETYVTLERGSGSRPGRAVVHTSYKSNKNAYVRQVQSILDARRS